MMIKRIDLNSAGLLRGSAGKKYRFNNNLALVVGRKGYIVLQCDCVHTVYPPGANAFLDVFQGPDSKGRGLVGPVGSAEVTFSQLKLCAKEVIPDLAKWIHLFGSRKQRVQRNYELFCDSCHEIDADIVLPRWEE